MIKQVVFLIVLSVGAVFKAQSFVLGSKTPVLVEATTRDLLSGCLPRQRDFKVRLAENENDETAKSVQNGESDASEGEETQSEADDSVEMKGEEDPELRTLKEEIAELESTLKSKRTTLAYTNDAVEEYSKAGYARKVAEMENMRRIRSVSV